MPYLCHGRVCPASTRKWKTNIDFSHRGCASGCTVSLETDRSKTASKRNKTLATHRVRAGKWRNVGIKPLGVAQKFNSSRSNEFTVRHDFFRTCLASEIHVASKCGREQQQILLVSRPKLKIGQAGILDKCLSYAIEGFAQPQHASGKQT